MDSSLAATRPTHPSVTRLRYTNGVFPINYSTSQKRFNLLLFLSQITSQCQSKKMPRRWRTRNHFGARSPRWHPWRWSHPLSRQESETNQIKNKNQEHTHTKKKNHPQNHHINPEKLQSNPIRDNREGGHCLPIWQRNNNNPCSSLGNGGSWSWRRKHQDARFYTGEEEGEVHDCAERRGPRCTVSLQVGPAGDSPDGRCTWTGGGAFVEPGRPWFARRQQREREAIEFSELWRNCPSHSSLSPSLSLPINKCLQLRKFNRGKTIWDYPIDLFMVCRIWRLRKFVCCRLWDIDIRVELFRLVLPMSKKKPTSINESGHTRT